MKVPESWQVRIDVFHNDVKRDVRRNLIGLKTTYIIASQSNFVYHLANRVDDVIMKKVHWHESYHHHCATSQTKIVAREYQKVG
jgi:hypothetical protein